ncbi:hypothetical protein GP486_000805 [Trichoglossum hirsutum]|uniref:PINIT domain-containing protein n=1 Tax=Trichoglossum hirsutum TaxID=265104 RepID=A0A9P8RTA4_9PEZI|nr:hypothetical protein GP486_000805 [Trichoglossum hirsutum]
MASTSQPLDSTAAVAKVQTLLNRYLVNILKAEGLPHSGIKAGMQQRIISQCPPMTSHRHSATAPLQFTPSDIEKLASDKTIRAMVYCAVESALASYTKADIAFPHQVELKVNNDEVKANLRGLKNKPGSTRPADITDLLHKKPRYENTITLTYALTQKKFAFVVNLVKVHPVEELANRLKMGKVISCEQAIKEMVNKAQDADLVATSTVMSLKCPLSTLRMELPCRSTLQEQAPTWTCPICNKLINFEALVVDQYVNNILQRTPQSVDQVTIEPDGKWSQNALPTTSGQINGSTIQNGDDDDDIIEIRDTRLTSLKSDYAPAPAPGPKTPSINSREPSAPLSSSSKRHVIDLTISDDEDEPPRPAKRTLTSDNFPNAPERRNGYRAPNNGPRLNGVSFHLPPGNSRSNPSPIGTPDR